MPLPQGCISAKKLDMTGPKVPPNKFHTICQETGTSHSIIHITSYNYDRSHNVRLYFRVSLRHK